MISSDGLRTTPQESCPPPRQPPPGRPYRTFPKLFREPSVVERTFLGTFGLLVSAVLFLLYSVDEKVSGSFGRGPTPTPKLALVALAGLVGAFSLVYVFVGLFLWLCVAPPDLGVESRGSGAKNVPVEDDPGQGTATPVQKKKKIGFVREDSSVRMLRVSPLILFALVSHLVAVEVAPDSLHLSLLLLAMLGSNILMGIAGRFRVWMSSSSPSTAKTTVNEDKHEKTSRVFAVLRVVVGVGLSTGAIAVLTRLVVWIVGDFRSSMVSAAICADSRWIWLDAWAVFVYHGVSAAADYYERVHGVHVCNTMELDVMSQLFALGSRYFVAVLLCGSGMCLPTVHYRKDFVFVVVATVGSIFAAIVAAWLFLRVRLSKWLFFPFAALWVAGLFLVLEFRADGLLTWIVMSTLRNGDAVSYWVGLFGLFAIVYDLFLWVLGRAPRIIRRKYFHLLIMFIAIPAIVFRESFFSAAGAIAFALLILIEISRLIFHFPFFDGFVDDRDGSVYLTHIYLLLGTLLPLWLPAPDADDSRNMPLRSMIGIVVLGVSDSMGSIVGTYWGRNRFWWNKKTLEGSLGATLSSFAVLVALFYRTLYSPYRMRRLLLVAATTSAFEAVTNQIDNLVLPLFGIAVVNMVEGVVMKLLWW